MNPYVPQGSDQSWGHFVQFARVVLRQLLKDLPAFACQVQEGSALVFLVRRSCDQFLTFQAVDQFNRAVVLEAEAACRIGDGDGCAFGSSCHLEEQLVLLRLQAGVERSAFAEL